jgi:hypothetical protein
VREWPETASSNNSRLQIITVSAFAPTVVLRGIALRKLNGDFYGLRNM